MGLDRLFGEEQALSDLTVDEPVGDELENLDLTSGRVLTELASRRGRERDDCAVAAGAPARGSRLEAATVVAVAIQDLLTLGGVHGSRIGGPRVPL